MNKNKKKYPILLKPLSNGYGIYKFYFHYKGETHREQQRIPKSEKDSIFQNWKQQIIQSNDHHRGKLLSSVKDYLLRCKTIKSPEQYKHIVRDLKIFCIFITKKNALKRKDLSSDPFLDEITKADCEDFCEWFTNGGEKKHAPGTTNRVLGSIRHFFFFCIDKNYLKNSNPVSRIKCKDSNEGSIRYCDLTDQQLKMIIDLAEPGYFQTYIMLLAFLGVRPKEARNLKWSDINLIDKTITLPWSITKSKKARVLNLPPVLLEYLKTVPREIEYIVSYNENPLKSCKKKWRTLIKKVIKVELQNGNDPNWAKPLTPYYLRHNFITQCVKQDIPLVRIANYVGHTTTRMIEKVYNHFKGGIKTEELNFFDDIFKHQGEVSTQKSVRQFDYLKIVNI